MLKDLLRTFLDGAIAGILYNFVGGLISTVIPPLPFGLSAAIVLGILVLVVDYILKNLAKL
ncbi:MAG: hypothetical protein HYS62_03580 [Candidatus Aenigmarchaeota archaeon]|nr:hypothetical protein [Candidatus Aenigmarchaeota archaeon]